MRIIAKLYSRNIDVKKKLFVLNFEAKGILSGKNVKMGK